MRKVYIYVLALFFLADVSVAKQKILTAEDLNCNKDDSYCENLSRRPLTGKVSRRLEDGLTTENYKNGKLSGLTTVWDKNGKFVSKTYYKDGQKNGVERFYYENRTIKSSAEYKNGKLHGRVEYYTPKGKLKGRLNYKDGHFDKGYCVINGQKSDIKTIGTSELISCGE